MKALVTLTSSESKRLIAKGIAAMEVVKKAYRKGIMAFSICSTNGFIIEEITGEKIERDKYSCGFISELGLCAADTREIHKEIAIVKGKIEYLDWPKELLTKYIKDMGSEDIFFKSGNAIDVDEKVGCLSAGQDGGEYGKYMPYIFSKGIKFIIPMTLNKTIPLSIDKVITEMGITKISPDMCHGLVTGMMPLIGEVVTEIEAIKTLTGAEAIPVAMNGLGSGEGSVTLLIQGLNSNVKRTWHIVQSIKGEPRLMERRPSCETCQGLSVWGLKCSTTKIFSKDK